MTMTEMRGQGASNAPAVAALSAMDQEDFERFILGSLGRDANPAIWDALTDPSVILRTRNTLVSIRTDVQNQITAANSELDGVHAECLLRGEPGKQDYLHAKSEQAEWRKRTAGFRRLIERRIAQVKTRLSEQAAAQPKSPPGTGKLARQHNRAALETLARAVMEHRRRVVSGEGGEDDDDALWAHLSSVTAINKLGEELPLLDWLEYLDDQREDAGQQ